MSFRLRASTVLVASLWVATLALAQTEHVLKEGDRAADFSITTDNGTRITPADFGGRLLVLNFWETACTPCVKELPSLRDFARKFRPQGVVVLAIRGDEDAVKYRNLLTDHRILVETHRDRSRQISKSFGTYMFPETYLIQYGRIVRKVVGDIDWMSEDIASFVRTRLARH